MSNTVTLEELKDLIVKICPNHIREYSNGTNDNPLPGTHWAVAAHGVVWYDPDCIHDTRDEAIYELVHGKFHSGDRQSAIALECQRLKAEVESLKWQLMKATGNEKP